MGLETFSCASGIEGEDWREFLSTYNDWYPT